MDLFRTNKSLALSAIVFWVKGLIQVFLLIGTGILCIHDSLLRSAPTGWIDLATTLTV